MFETLHIRHNYDVEFSEIRFVLCHHFLSIPPVFQFRNCSRVAAIYFSSSLQRYNFQATYWSNTQFSPYFLDDYYCWHGSASASIFTAHKFRIFFSSFSMCWCVFENERTLSQHCTISPNVIFGVFIHILAFFLSFFRPQKFVRLSIFCFFLTSISYMQYHKLLVSDIIMSRQWRRWRRWQPQQQYNTYGWWCFYFNQHYCGKNWGLLNFFRCSPKRKKKKQRNIFANKVNKNWNRLSTFSLRKKRIRKVSRLVSLFSWSPNRILSLVDYFFSALCPTHLLRTISLLLTAMILYCDSNPHVCLQLQKYYWSMINAINVLLTNAKNPSNEFIGAIYESVCVGPVHAIWPKSCLSVSLSCYIIYIFFSLFSSVNAHQSWLAT